MSRSNVVQMSFKTLRFEFNFQLQGSPIWGAKSLSAQNNFFISATNNQRSANPVWRRGLLHVFQDSIL